MSHFGKRESRTLTSPFLCVRISLHAYRKTDIRSLEYLHPCFAGVEPLQVWRGKHFGLDHLNLHLIVNLNYPR